MTANFRREAMSDATPTPSPSKKPSQARWAKPLPQLHKNFIPAQSWLAYSWLDKDPELDFVCAAIEQSGMTLEQIERECEKFGHRVSKYTLMAWLYKDTRRPQNVTMNTVMAICGYERPWRKVR